jgi:hypothetical protein
MKGKQNQIGQIKEYKESLVYPENIKIIKNLSRQFRMQMKAMCCYCHLPKSEETNGTRITFQGI